MTSAPAVTESARSEGGGRADESSLGSGLYLPGLDGLRAFSVVAVMIGHLSFEAPINWPWLPGEWLGVTTFFTISGFLIARLLLIERDRSGRVSFTSFWARRARRLFPALVTALVALMVLASLGLTPPDVRLPAQFIATLFYVKNWHFLDFGGAHGAVLFQYWSLSIEEQFYLVFPIVFGLSYALLGKRLTGWLFVACAAASFVYLDHVNRIGAWRQAYFGTLTRVCEILAGVVLAFAVTSPCWRRFERNRVYRRALQVAGIAGGLTLLWLWHTQPVNSLEFQYSVLLDVAATIAVIVACAVPGGVNKLLSLRPLRFLGRVSYGAYLYHLGVYHLLTPARLHLHGNVQIAVVRFIATFAVSGFSYRFIERPLRNRPSRGRQVAAFYAVAFAGVIVLALTLPFPRAITFPPPTGPQSIFNDSNSKSEPTASRVTVIGDDLAQSILPTLHDVVGKDHRYAVTVRTAEQCPMSGPLLSNLGGRVTYPSIGCHMLWQNVATGLRFEKQGTVVIALGLGDVPDLAPLGGDWHHAGEKAFDDRFVAAFQDLATQVAQSKPKRVVVLLMPPATALASYEHQSATARATPSTGKVVDAPPEPTPTEAAARIAVIDRLIRTVAASHPGFEVRMPADRGSVILPYRTGQPAGPALIPAETWKAILTGRG